MGTISTRTASLVRRHPIRPSPRPSADTGDPDPGQDRPARGESPRCPEVTSSDNDFWLCSTARWALVVHPRRPPQRVVGRFWLAHSARRLFPLGAVGVCARRVLVGPVDGGVRAHVPGDQTGRVGPGLQRGQDHRPHPGTRVRFAPRKGPASVLVEVDAPCHAATDSQSVQRPCYLQKPGNRAAVRLFGGETRRPRLQGTWAGGLVGPAEACGIRSCRWSSRSWCCRFRRRCRSRSP